MPLKSSPFQAAVDLLIPFIKQPISCIPDSYCSKQILAHKETCTAVGRNRGYRHPIICFLVN